MNKILYGVAALGLLIGATVMLALVSLVATPTVELQVLGGGSGNNEHGASMHLDKVGGTTGFSRDFSGFGGGRGEFKLSLLDPSLNEASITVNGLIVDELVDGVSVPVLVTQQAYYLLQSSQPTPPNAYVTVTGVLTIYSVSPYDQATDCSPFDCSYLVLQVQVTQLTILYQGN